MQTNHTLPNPDVTVGVFVQELPALLGRSVGTGSPPLVAWMEAADASAIDVQHSLNQTKKTALHVTLVDIVRLLNRPGF